MRLKRIRKLICAALMLLFAVLGCGENIFEGASNKGTDSALLEEARILMDRQDFSGALTTLASMTAAGQAEREVMNITASAYAGRCGMTFFDLFNLLSNMSNSLLTELMAGFPGATATHLDDCVAAESVLATIGGVADRTGSENLLMSLVAFAKMGVILSKNADADDDGTADGGFDYCATISEAEMKEFVTAMGNLLLSLPATGSSLGGSGTSAISSICAALPPNQNFCQIVDVTNVTADHVLAMRGMVGSTDDPGLGTCANDVATCIAACP
jgi:hypothetical protein